MITFKNISKNFNNTVILDNISFTIRANEFIVLIGASGSGKTTLLKLINRLTFQNSGSIFIHGKNIEDENPIHLRRKLGYVIQKVGLFPHMTVAENISLILQLDATKKNKVEMMAQVRDVMEIVGLDYDAYASRYPSELSGGQQQRVGIARALITKPDIILMDEPFSALDPITRSHLQHEIVQLHKKTQTTIVFVTHDMDEALRIADRICFLHEGRVVQIDTPKNMLQHPKSDEVTTFFGKQRLWFYPEYISAAHIMNTNFQSGSALDVMETGDFQVIISADKYRLYRRNKKTGQFVEEDFSCITKDVTVRELIDQPAGVYLVVEEKQPKGIITETEMLFVYQQMQKEMDV